MLCYELVLVSRAARYTHTWLPADISHPASALHRRCKGRACRIVWLRWSSLTHLPASHARPPQFNRGSSYYVVGERAPKEPRRLRDKGERRTPRGGGGREDKETGSERHGKDTRHDETDDKMTMAGYDHHERSLWRILALRSFGFPVTRPWLIAFLLNPCCPFPPMAVPEHWEMGNGKW